jgi:hypothetical protein
MSLNFVISSRLTNLQESECVRILHGLPGFLSFKFSHGFIRRLDIRFGASNYYRATGEELDACPDDPHFRDR